MRIGTGIIVLLAGVLLCSCANSKRYSAMQSELESFVSDKDAEIGIAVIIDGRDTVAVNGSRQFPMLSVYKFPISLVFAESCRADSMGLDITVEVTEDDLHPGTYSPMTEKLLASAESHVSPLMLPAKDLLEYMLQFSDNNASDIILRAVGGPGAVQRYLAQIGVDGINVRSSEDEMHDDNGLCYANSASPVAMAELFDRFDTGFNDPVSMEIKHILESCSTGVDRLAKPLLPTNAIIGHKTGTGFILSDGKIMAVNDAGYVHLPNGQRFSIAVFVENSGYDLAQTEALISGISRIVLAHVSGNKER